MTPADVYVGLVALLAIFTIGAWWADPPSPRKDARRRNPRATAPEPWWRGEYPRPVDPSETPWWRA